MNTIITVLITLFVYWFIGLIIYELTDENDTFIRWWATGLVYAFLWLFFAPYRIINRSMRK